MTGGTGTCHTSDFAFDTCVKSIFQDITFSVFAYDINKKGVSLQKNYESMKEDQKIVIYQTPDGKTQIDVRLEDETVWLTQAQMAQLFKSSRTNVLEHIQHIYEVEELEKEATCRNFRQVRQEGKRMVNRTMTR